MKKILVSVLTIAVVAGVGLAATNAFFNDTETSTGNTLVAGALDLRIDSTAHYAGMICTDGVWVEEGSGTSTRPDLLGLHCDGTWSLKDLGQGDTFFNLADLKPGDQGENTISMHVDNNDAYMCAVIDNMHDDDNGLTEPESEVDLTGGLGEGELSQEIHFFAWADDGDNVWENGEQPLFSNEEGPASDVIDGVVYPLFTPANGVFEGGTDGYIGLYWCYGDMTVGTNTLSCDGQGGTNLTQTDSLTADISFYVEQARNNGDFRCPTIEEWRQSHPVQRPLVGAALDEYQAPTHCDVTVTDNDNLQAKIDSATQGYTLCLEDGTYNEFVVNKPLTIAGLTNPNTGSAKVVPSSTAVNELAMITSSDVTIMGIHFSGGGITNSGNQMAGVQISPAGSDINNVHIVYNIIDDLAVNSATASNKGIQWFVETDEGHALTNSSFENNVIDNISSTNKGGYGIQSVGAMQNVTINQNTVSNISGAWGAGMAFDTKDTSLTPMSGVSVMHNQILDSVHNGVSLFAVQIEHSLAGAGIIVDYNNVQSLVHGGGNATLGGEGTVDATHNWWGDVDPSDDTAGDVNYTPFEGSAFSLN